MRTAKEMTMEFLRRNSWLATVALQMLVIWVLLLECMGRGEHPSRRVLAETVIFAIPISGLMGYYIARLLRKNAAVIVGLFINTACLLSIILLASADLSLAESITPLEFPLLREARSGAFSEVLDKGGDGKWRWVQVEKSPQD
jgi:hypothetical protein